MLCLSVAFGLKASDRGFFDQRHDFYLKQKTMRQDLLINRMYRILGHWESASNNGLRAWHSNANILEMTVR